METVTTLIQSLGEKLELGLTELLMQHSALTDTTRRDSEIVFFGPPYAWSERTLDASRLQSKLLEDYAYLFTLVGSLLHGQPDATRMKLSEDNDSVRECIEQTHCVWHSTTAKALASAIESLNRIVGAVGRLYDSTEGAVLLVPDTNALLSAPPFERWTFSGIPTFSIVLVPTVLKELDALKINHRNQDVRDKAQALIRQLQEYRRRGSLNQGVHIVKGSVLLQAVASEPTTSESLPWLDASNDDDRLIATAIELMRQHPRCPVVIVTGDINLQNKAEFARVQLIEPPTLK